MMSQSLGSGLRSMASVTGVEFFTSPGTTIPRGVGGIGASARPPRGSPAGCAFTCPVATDRMATMLDAVNAWLPGRAPLKSRMNAVTLTYAGSPRLPGFEGGMAPLRNATRSLGVRSPQLLMKSPPANAEALLIPPRSAPWQLEQLA